VSLSQPEVLHDIMLCRVSVDIHYLKYCHVHWSMCVSLENYGIVLQQETHSATELRKTNGTSKKIAHQLGTTGLEQPYRGRSTCSGGVLTNCMF
jgi:hypothetical protein